MMTTTKKLSLLHSQKVCGFAAHLIFGI